MLVLLRGPHLISGSGGFGRNHSLLVVVAPGRRNERSYEDTRDLAARVLSDVLETTANPGVTLALEPIISWQSDYLNTLGEALDLVDLVGHPRLGVYPDTFHLWRTGTLLEDIERAGPRIVGVHLNDAVDGSPMRCLAALHASTPIRTCFCGRRKSSMFAEVPLDNRTVEKLRP